MTKRKLLLRMYDLLIIFTVYISMIEFYHAINSAHISFSMIVICTLIIASVYMVLYEIFGIYRTVWRYATQTDYFKLLISSVLAGAIIAPLLELILEQSVTTGIIIGDFISLLILMSIRMMYNIFEMRKRAEGEKETKRTLIVGGGWTAKNLLPQLMSRTSEYTPLGFVDDDKEIRGRNISGLPVLGTTSDIPKICREHSIKTIIFAIPSINTENERRIMKLCFQSGCELKRLPHIDDIINRKNLYSEIKAVKIEDLLGREQLKFEDKNVSALIKGRVVLITGGGGSIGSELSRQIAKYAPKRLLIIDNYENNAYSIQQELIREYGKKLLINVEIFSVCDRKRMEIFFDKYKPNIVFHAAAHKHVPFMETTPEQAIKNNVGGTLTCAETACKYGVSKFIMISTDKAVRPTNIMGASKRICEKTIRCVAKSENCNTEFAAVRFGNVLGSNGSVIPLFKSQIKKGGPLTVTDKNVIRYFMTIPEAVSLVMEAGSLARGNEVFILDMGDPMKIVDLAENLIRLSGYIPYKDIDIVFTGLRPGEKMYEELLLQSEEVTTTESNKIYIGKQKPFDEQLFRIDIDTILEYAHNNEIPKVMEMIKKMVTSFDHAKNDKNTKNKNIKK